jgi:hypothetical protein
MSMVRGSIDKDKPPRSAGPACCSCELKKPDSLGIESPFSSLSMVFPALDTILNSGFVRGYATSLVGDGLVQQFVF